LENDASIKTGKWRGYQPLGKEFCNLLQIESGKKGNIFLICIGPSWVSKAGSEEYITWQNICRNTSMYTATDLTVAF